jgi:hypothetical protein
VQTEKLPGDCGEDPPGCNPLGGGKNDPDKQTRLFGSTRPIPFLVSVDMPQNAGFSNLM